MLATQMCLERFGKLSMNSSGRHKLLPLEQIPIMCVLIERLLAFQILSIALYSTLFNGKEIPLLVSQIEYLH